MAPILSPPRGRRADAELLFRALAWWWDVPRHRPPRTVHPGGPLMLRPDADASRASALLRDLRAEALPPWLPAEPHNLAATLAADRAARALLAMLARKHGVQRWDWDAFRDLFLEGLLAAAKPGTHVVEQGRDLLIMSPQCPLLAEARLDPRACAFCRMLPEAAARQAIPGVVEQAGYEGLITAGDPACVLRLRRAPLPGTACGEVPA